MVLDPPAVGQMFSHVTTVAAERTNPYTRRIVHRRRIRWASTGERIIRRAVRQPAHSIRYSCSILKEN